MKKYEAPEIEVQNIQIEDITNDQINPGDNNWTSLT